MNELQNHHIIPAQFRDDVLALTSDLIDLDTWAQNRMLLPGDSRLAGQTGLPRHVGPHG